MGKKRNKRNKDRKIGPLLCEPTPQPSLPKLPEDRTKPTKKPQMIPLSTFDTISDYMLQLPAPYRNVFLSVKEYLMTEINPLYVMTKDSPTHVLVFCMRLVMTDYFAPIGLVQVNSREDQTDKLVTVWKAFIQDLSILRLHVIGSISPATPMFHNVLGKLTENPNLYRHTDPVTYSVWPYKEILHLYDIPSIMDQLQEAFYQLVDLYFITRPESGQISDATPPNDMKMYNACWTDVLLALASGNIKCIYTVEEVAPDVSIYSAEFQEVYNSYSELAIKTTPTKPSTDHLLQILWKFIESTATNTDLTPDDIQDFYDKNENLRILLASARFRNFDDEVYFLMQPENNEDYILVESDLQRDLAGQPVPEAILNSEDGASLIDKDSPYSIEISDNQYNNIITIIDNSLNDDNEPFDSFVKKFVYNHDILFNRKPTPAEEQNTPLRADVGLTQNNSDLKKETVEQKESRIFTIVKEYFEGLKIKNQNNLQEHSKIDVRDSAETIMDVKADFDMKIHDSSIQNSAVNRKRSRTFSKRTDSPSDSTMSVPDHTPNMPGLSCEDCVNGSCDLHVSKEYINAVKSVLSNEKLTLQEGCAIESTKDENQLSFKKRKESPASNEYCVQQDGFESNELLDYGNSYSRILDGLDLAGSGKDTFEASVSSVVDSAVRDFYTKSVSESIANKPIKSTDSVDSLAELVSTFDEDDALTKLPSKYNVPKKIGTCDKKQFDELKRSRHFNSKLLTNDDSHYMFNLLRLKKNYGISQKRNYFNAGKPEAKTPIEELQTLMNQVSNGDKDNIDIFNKIDQLSDSIYDNKGASPKVADTLEEKSTQQDSKKLQNVHNSDETVNEGMDTDEQHILEYRQLGTILEKLAKYTTEMKKDIKAESPKNLNSVSKFPERSSIIKDAEESERIEYDLLRTLTGIYVDQIEKENRSESQSINKKENNPEQYTNIKQNNKSKTADQTMNKKKSMSKENMLESSIQPMNKPLKTYEASKTKTKNVEHRTSFEDNLRGFFNSDKVKNTAESVNKNENCCMENNEVAQTKTNNTESRTSFEDNLRGYFNSDKSKTTSQSLSKRENNNVKDKAIKTKSEFDSNNIPEPMNKKERLDKTGKAKLQDLLENKIFKENNDSSNYLKPNIKTVDSKILPCCSIPSSSSDFHFPYYHIKEHVTLPHYTRFDMFESDSGDRSPASIGTTSHVPVANEIITQSIENDDLQFIDYQTYRKNLEASLCDKRKPNCDTIFKDKDCLNKILSSIPKGSLEIRCTTDWLCTFKGYLKLKEILVRRQVRSIKPNLFCLDHINYYIALIRKLKNHMFDTVYDGHSYKFVDYKSAFDLLKCGVGVYMLTKDGVDTINSDDNIKN